MLPQGHPDAYASFHSESHFGGSIEPRKFQRIPRHCFISTFSPPCCRAPLRPGARDWPARSGGLWPGQLSGLPGWALLERLPFLEALLGFLGFLKFRLDFDLAGFDFDSDLI